MSRSWLLYLDDLIAAGEKIGRLTDAHDRVSFAADEAVFDAVLFNLLVIGEAVKKLPMEGVARLSASHRVGPARLRDLIAHHYFSIDPDIVWDVATHHVPALLHEARALRDAEPTAGRGSPGD